MLIQLLSTFTVIVGGLFTGFLAGVISLFLVAWFTSIFKHPTRFAIQAVFALVFFAPALFYLCIYVQNDWLLAASASVSFLWCMTAFLRQES